MVKLPSGKPYRQVYAMEGLAMQKAAAVRGRVVKVKWNPEPLPKPEDEGGKDDAE
jgi:hypothetical protein